MKNISSSPEGPFIVPSQCPLLQSGSGMTPKDSYVKRLVLHLALLEDCRTFKRWDLVGSLIVTGCMPLIGIVGPPCPSSSCLSFAAGPWNEQLCSIKHSLLWHAALLQAPKQQGQNLWIKTITVSPNKLFPLLNWLSQISVTVKESWLIHPYG
jgi:hypothetical protein